MQIYSFASFHLLGLRQRHASFRLLGPDIGAVAMARGAFNTNVGEGSV
jgi:hypothetical protein